MRVKPSTRVGTGGPNSSGTPEAEGNDEFRLKGRRDESRVAVAPVPQDTSESPRCAMGVTGTVYVVVGSERDVERLAIMSRGGDLYPIYQSPVSRI